MHKNIEIVISRFNERLDWLKDPLFDEIHFIIYNKGINKDFYTPKNCKIINLPNYGRCDQTYLYHIVTNYKSLSNITIFLPGSSDMLNKMDKTRFIVKCAIKNNIACFPVEKCNDIYQKFRYFKLDNWNSSYSINQTYNNNNVQPAKLRPYGIWYKYHFGNNICKYFSINSIFALNKDDILKYSQSRYAYFCNMISFCEHPEACHYLERSWALIFGPFSKTCLIKLK